MRSNVVVSPPRVALAALAFVVLVAAPAAHAQQRQSGLQITPNGRRVLISKDLGGQRWAITRNLNDGTVTGNVYDTGGGDPTFLFCAQSSATVEEVVLSCYGAPRCTAGPCGGVDFSLIADVTLPQSFFLPPVGASAAADAPDAAAALDAPPVAVASHVVASGSVAGGGARQSGLQITPDTLRTLISKDVGGQRWAITRNADDDTVTGNVYQDDGGDPLFVFCTQTSESGTEVRLSCSGAPPCSAAPCPPEQFAFIADVALPRSFFTPPPTPPPAPPATCGNGVIDQPAEECDGADLGELDCFTATRSLEDCTGTLGCRSDCRFDVSACNCPCEGDFDCGVPIDCEPYIAGCMLEGACEAGRCVTNQTGTRELCEGVDPDDPDSPRWEQCPLP
jgi:hypothetical protein